MKQIFKGQMLTLNSIVNNILSVYERADKSFKNDWYSEANMFASHLAVMYDIPITIVCGIIAALSPIKTWEQNKLITETFLRTGKAKHVKLFQEKAEAIYASDGDVTTIAEILNGRKITAFFLNILTPNCSNAITIDRHALSIILGYSVSDKQYRGITATQYEFMVSAYHLAGKRAGISPILMQSITWQQWRAERGIIENILTGDEVPF